MVAIADPACARTTATEKGTKKVAGETKDAVQTRYACADGTTDQATLKTNACRDHGGVKAERRAKPKH